MNRIRSVSTVLSIAILCISFAIRKDDSKAETSTTKVVEAEMTPFQIIHKEKPKTRHKIYNGDLQGMDLNLIPGCTEADNFDNWDPPPALSRDFPSYIAGFDNSSRPINSISEIWLNGLYGVRFLHFRSSRLQKNTTTWIYGTNKYDSAPKLAQEFPVDQLPEWYGGPKGSKPYYVVG